MHDISDIPRCKSFCKAIEEFTTSSKFSKSTITNGRRNEYRMLLMVFEEFAKQSNRSPREYITLRNVCEAFVDSALYSKYQRPQDAFYREEINWMKSNFYESMCNKFNIGCMHV